MHRSPFAAKDLDRIIQPKFKFAPIVNRHFSHTKEIHSESVEEGLVNCDDPNIPGSICIMEDKMTSRNEMKELRC